MNNINNLINGFRSKQFSENIVFRKTIDPIKAEMHDFPVNMSKVISDGLSVQGVRQLYSHQAIAFESVLSGKNVVISTGTASGKTYCYNLPVFQSLIQEAGSTSIYLFPTKALTSDQLKKIHELNAGIISVGHSQIVGRISPAIYDGDTSINDRNQIRKIANIILTNPDMLHIGILPHHTNWDRIFRNLRYVVIDEIHVYRGVFGSHLGNVIRRLKRICEFYGSAPTFIMTSATIANAKEFVQKLIESPVTLIEKDGSAYGKRNFILYNPPIINKDLGLRNGIIAETVNISKNILENQIQTIFFARSRKTVEVTLRNLHSSFNDQFESMHGYRSGYLPRERRAIENGLRDGSIRAVVSTNALELGIDMGGMDAIVMMGYPGSIAAFRQQSGRAGRMKTDSLAMLLASSSPLDQFIIQHPTYLFEKSPENALINPDNPLILLDHVRCALFELPFMENETFGSVSWKDLKQYLELLVFSREVIYRSGRFTWMKDDYPANQISLRRASAQPYLLICNQRGKHKTIGEVDEESANWMVHPGAIYLHEGISYQVDKLDFEKHVAELSLTDVDFFTEPQKEIDIQKVNGLKSEKEGSFQRYLGDILVTSKVTGFQKIRWFTYEVLSEESLEMPKSELNTIAYWLTLPKELIDNLRQKKLWLNDPIEYGPEWSEIRKKVRARDGYRCQVCGVNEIGIEHHVHHKIPFRTFAVIQDANEMDNLVTLCGNCHQRVEQNVRIKSGLAGLGYILSNLAPVILMCDEKDLGTIADSQAKWADQQPSVLIFDQFPGGIGLSETFYSHDKECIQNAYELVKSCHCRDGCPSCVGPAGENGLGAKEPTMAILEKIRQ